MESRKKSLRGWWVVLVIAAVVLLFGSGLLLALYTASPSDGVAVLGRDRIAILPLRGVITGNHLVIRQLRTYRKDKSVKGYVLWIDSPGGEVAPSQTLYRQIRRVREDGYPVVAAIGSVGASGAYYAALGADSILAMPGSLVGSIGVVMEFPVAKELLEKLGLQFEVVKSAEHKDLGSPYREASEGDRALLQTIVDDVYGQFVDAIAEERGLTSDSVVQIADGRLLSGRLAIEYGLVDAEGDLVDAIATAGNMAGLGPEPRTVLREERRATWLDLMRSVARSAWSGSDAADAIAGAWKNGALHRWPRLLYQLP